MTVGTEGKFTADTVEEIARERLLARTGVANPSPNELAHAMEVVADILVSKPVTELVEALRIAFEIFGDDAECHNPESSEGKWKTQARAALAKALGQTEAVDG